MTDYAIAHVAGGDTHVLAEACAKQLRDTEGHNLGFLYVTDELAGALDGIVKLLKARTGISNWVGTVGRGTHPVTAMRGDHWQANFSATVSRNLLLRARTQVLGRRAFCQARSSALVARYL